MSDIKLFRIDRDKASELPGSALAVERRLQNMMEANLEAMLGVRFVASEYSTGPVHGGRIDSLGLDENGSPVIVEYKRATNENVINQGLFYLDWLLDHRGEFTLLAMRHLGPGIQESIDWTAPRLICVAGDFTRYDEHAVQQIGRNIELYRYRWYEEGYLLLELVNRPVRPNVPGGSNGRPSTEPGGTPPRRGKTVTEYLAQSPPDLRARYEAAHEFLCHLGDDVTVKTNLDYVAYRRIRNFACVEVHPQTGQLLVYLNVDPDTVDRDDDFARDVRTIGHFGTGDLSCGSAPTPTWSVPSRSPNAPMTGADACGQELKTARGCVPRRAARCRSSPFSGGGSHAVPTNGLGLPRESEAERPLARRGAARQVPLWRATRPGHGR